jgi:hypothetical protein
MTCKIAGSMPGIKNNLSDSKQPKNPALASPGLLY